jgi:hypothetical protein
MDEFMQTVIDEASTGRDEGGIPIGSVLVLDGEITGRGHNRRVQKGSVSAGLTTPRAGTRYRYAFPVQARFDRNSLSISIDNNDFMKQTEVAGHASLT